MSRRRRHRKRLSVYSIQDFDNYISEKIGNSYLELKRLLLRAQYLVKVHRDNGRGYRWVPGGSTEKGTSIVGFWPRSRQPAARDDQFDAYHQMITEQNLRLASEPISETVPEPTSGFRRPPPRRTWRSVARRAPSSHAA